MIESHLEKIFLHYLLQRKELLEVVNTRFFDNGDLKKIYETVQEFVKKYHEVPTKSQVIELIKIKGLSEEITQSKIEKIYEVNLKEYDEDWLRETAESWIEYKNLDLSVYDLLGYLKSTKVSPENVKDVVQTAKNIIAERNNIAFSFDEGLDFFNPDSHKQPIYDTFKSGIEYIDLVLGGGFYSKAFFIFLGPAKSGKSIWLANIAASSVLQGYNTAVVSLEMRDRKVIKRLGANLLNVSMREYNNFAEDKLLLKQKLSELGFSNLTQPGKLIVKEFPTSSAGVPDVENYLLKMQELKGIKFKMVIIDYVNILKNWRNPNSENTYMKIKQIAEDLRAMAMRNDWAIVSATQTNRGGNDNTDLTLTNVSESGALGHTVDAMFGIIQDEIMHANREYILKLIANRDEGYKNSRQKFLINYDYMKLYQDPNSPMITE